MCQIPSNLPLSLRRFDYSCTGAMDVFPPYPYEAKICLIKRLKLYMGHPSNLIADGVWGGGGGGSTGDRIISHLQHQSDRTRK